jgi:hypothetical protein
MARGHCCLQLIATVIDNLIVILLQVLLLFLGLVVSWFVCVVAVAVAVAVAVSTLLLLYQY